MPSSAAQPAAGPGGSAYAFARVGKFSTGTGSEDVTIFWPESPAPKEKLPLVVFAHGWGAMDPVHYEAWIEHFVRKGAIVLYPRYQESLRVKAGTFTANAVAGVRRGLDWLAKRKEGAQPDLARVATVGHSAGGVLASNLAVALPAAKLPNPRAVMSVEPGITRGPKGTLLPLADLNRIAPTTLLLVVSGEDDELVGDNRAARSVIVRVVSLDPVAPFSHTRWRESPICIQKGSSHERRQIEKGTGTRTTRRTARRSASPL